MHLPQGVKQQNKRTKHEFVEQAGLQGKRARNLDSSLCKTFQVGTWPVYRAGQHLVTAGSAMVLQSWFMMQMSYTIGFGTNGLPDT